MTLMATFVAPAAVRPTAADLRMVAGTEAARFARIAMIIVTVIIVLGLIASAVAYPIAV